MNIDPKKTYIALNHIGRENKVAGHMIQELLQRDQIIVAEIDDEGNRHQFEEPLTKRPIARKIFSTAWNDKREEKLAAKEAEDAESVTDGEQALVDETKHYCMTCGFTAKSHVGLLAHKRKHKK